MGSECFECGATEDLHEHHVVPKSLGGTKTITLCQRCHDKVHAVEKTSISNLTKLAIKKRKDEGKRYSRHPPYGYTVDDSNNLIENIEEIQLMEYILELKGYGLSQRGIAEQLNKEGKYNRIGKPFRQTQIHRILNAIKNRKL